MIEGIHGHLKVTPQVGRVDIHVEIFDPSEAPGLVFTGLIVRAGQTIKSATINAPIGRSHHNFVLRVPDFDASPYTAKVTVSDGVDTVELASADFTLIDAADMLNAHFRQAMIDLMADSAYLTSIGLPSLSAAQKQAIGKLVRRAIVRAIDAALDAQKTSITNQASQQTAAIDQQKIEEGS